MVALVVSTTIHPALALDAQTTGATQGPPSIGDLGTVLDTGVVLQDRNGDDVVDFVDARILLGMSPTEAEVAAAANLAARLGYETSAVDMGLLGSTLTRDVHTSPVFLVGSGALDGAGVGGDVLAGLAPGQGVVAHLAPDARFRAGAVALAGYDATGLLATTAYFSGRYPGVWAPDGTEWKELAEKAEAFVEGLQVGEAGVSLDRIIIDGSRPGVARARMTVEVANDSAFQAVVDAFEAKDVEGDTLEAEGAAEGAGAGGEAVAGAAVEEAEADSAQAEAGGEGQEGRPKKPTTLSDLETRNLHRIDVRIVTPAKPRPSPFGRKSHGILVRTGLSEPVAMHPLPSLASIRWAGCTGTRTGTWFRTKLLPTSR